MEYLICKKCQDVLQTYYLYRTEIQSKHYSSSNPPLQDFILWLNYLRILDFVINHKQHCALKL